MDKFADRLKHALEVTKGVDPADVAKACQVTVQAIYQWRNGSTKGAKPEHLIRAARALKVRPEWLVLGEDPMRPILPPDMERALASLPDEQYDIIVDTIVSSSNRLRSRLQQPAEKETA